MKAYEELKNQIQLVNEKNSKMQLQNEMMFMKAQQHQEAMIMQLNEQNRIQQQKKILSQQQSHYNSLNKTHIDENYVSNDQIDPRMNEEPIEVMRQPK